MTETQDWNSGQGAYPSDNANHKLLLVNEATDERVVRHLSALPTLDEIKSLCDDEMGDTERKVVVSWYLDSGGGETDGKVILKPTGGAA